MRITIEQIANAVMVRVEKHCVDGTEMLIWGGKESDGVVPGESVQVYVNLFVSEWGKYRHPGGGNYMCVPIAEVEAFIEKHGGEA